MNYAAIRLTRKKKSEQTPTFGSQTDKASILE